MKRPRRAGIAAAALPMENRLHPLPVENASRVLRGVQAGRGTSARLKPGATKGGQRVVRAFPLRGLIAPDPRRK
jgi:hypothetical protein